MPQSYKIKRIEAQFCRELSRAALAVLGHFPKISFVSFTAVEINRDFSQAKVFTSFISSNIDEQRKIVEELNKNRGQLRKYLASNMNLKKMPELFFFYDTSIEYGEKMDKLIENIVKKDENN